MMMISREEALSLLDKFSERPLMRCSLSTSSLDFWVEGNLRREGDKVFIEAGNFSFTMRLVGDLAFEYREPKDLLGVEPTDKIVSGLVVGLPLRVLVLSGLPTRDAVFFFELDV
jgi:hypothetical protein